MGILLAVMFGVGFASLLYWAKYQVDRRAIVRDVERHQATVQGVRSRTGFINREWDVTYVDREGKSCADTCYVQQGWTPTVFWRNGFTHAARLSPMSTIAIECKCGEMLGVNLSQAGLVTRCESCKQEVLVPSRSEIERIGEN